ncbi:MAG: hypothetical protein AAFP13_05800 [Pseudomonadota bacterium]
MDIRDKHIEALVRGKSFAEIGGLWGATAERISVAHEYGARSLMMIDILPPLNKWWGEFRKRMTEKGVEKYKTLSVDIMSSRCQPFQVTHSSGILYHCPNPLQYL